MPDIRKVRDWTDEELEEAMGLGMAREHQNVVEFEIKRRGQKKDTSRHWQVMTVAIIAALASIAGLIF